MHVTYKPLTYAGEIKIYCIRIYVFILNHHQTAISEFNKKVKKTCKGAFRTDVVLDAEYSADLCPS